MLQFIIAIIIGTGIIFFGFPLGPLGFYGWSAIISVLTLSIFIVARGSFEVSAFLRLSAITCIVFACSILAPSIISPQRLVGDLRYLLSWLNIWVIMFAIYQFGTVVPKKFSRILKVGVLYIAIGIILGWAGIAFSSGGFFALRSKLSFPLIEYTVFGNPNEFARTGLAVMAVLGYFISIKQMRWGLALLVMLSGAIISTLSRTNIAGLVLFWGAFFFVNSCKGKLKIALLKSPILLLPGLALVVFLMSNEEFHDRMTVDLIRITEEIAGERVPHARALMLNAATQLVAEYPIIGVGYSDVKEKLEELGSIQGTRSLARGQYEKGDDSNVVMVHGALLQLMTISGLIAVIPLIVFLYILGLRAYRTWRTGSTWEIRCAGIWLLAYELIFIFTTLSAGTFRCELFWVVTCSIGVLAWRKPASLFVFDFNTDKEVFGGTQPKTQRNEYDGHAS